MYVWHDFFRSLSFRVQGEPSQTFSVQKKIRLPTYLARKVRQLRIENRAEVLMELFVSYFTKLTSPGGDMWCRLGMMVTGGITSASVMSASTSLISSLNECGSVVFPAVFSWYLSLPSDVFRFHIKRTTINKTNEIKIPLMLPIRYMYNFSLFSAKKKNIHFYFFTVR